MAEQQPTITIEDGVIIFKNFSGKEDPPYNPKGMRNFGVIITPDIAERLLADGWNVKYLRPREEGDDPTPYLPVALRFDIRPPRITLITSSGRKILTQETVSILDDIEFQTVDLICRPHDWEVGDKGGRKAYLATMYATMAEDELDRKYAVKEADPSAEGAS